MNTATRGRYRRKTTSRARHPSSKVKINFGALQVPYSADDADLELKSSDGVVFKLKSYILKAASGVFRDMLESSAASTTVSQFCPLLNAPQPPIEISSPSVVVRLFVDLIHNGELLDTISHPLGPAPTPAEVQATEAALPKGPRPHFADMFRPANTDLIGRKNGVKLLTELLELLDRFDGAVGFRKLALLHFEPVFRFDPWAVFVIAARYNDVPMAKKAIASIAELKEAERWKFSPGNMTKADGDKVPFEWMQGYWRAHADVSKTQAHLAVGQKENAEQFWKNVAAAFTNSTPEPPKSRTQTDSNQRGLQRRVLSTVAM